MGQSELFYEWTEVSEQNKIGQILSHHNRSVRVFSESGISTRFPDRKLVVLSEDERFSKIYYGSIVVAWDIILTLNGMTKQNVLEQKSQRVINGSTLCLMKRSFFNVKCTRVVGDVHFVH